MALNEENRPIFVLIGFLDEAVFFEVFWKLITFLISMQKSKAQQ